MAVSLHRTLFAASGLVAVTFAVWQPAMGQPPGGREGGRGMFRMPLMTAIDADGDGEISASEINDAPAHLRGLDANKDGRLTPDELRPAGGPAGGAGGAAGGEEMVNRLMEYDTDKDGRLKAEDLPERMRNIIARADANKDGFVDRAELLATNRSEGGQRGEGRREGDRGGFRGGDPAAFVDRLFEYDADKDGKLSREELAAMRGPGGREGGDRREGAGGGRRPPVEE